MNNFIEKKEEITDKIEVIINRHSPIPNFEIMELCAEEIFERVFLTALQEAYSAGEGSVIMNAAGLIEKGMTDAQTAKVIYDKAKSEALREAIEIGNKWFEENFHYGEKISDDVYITEKEFDNFLKVIKQKMEENK